MSALNRFLCVTCGTQYPDSPVPPPHCPICEDERQYVGLDGQRWTTLDDLRRVHTNELIEWEPGVTAIRTHPAFAIGQRAFYVESLLWDCVALLDGATVNAIRQRGGLKAIAISHPHYYTAMVEWMDAFDVPVYLHEADSQWIMRPDPRIVIWSGETRRLHDGLTLIRAGGHFDGGTVLHWPAGAGGKGALFTGDIIQVVPDRRWVSFMYSYPNLIPLSLSAVHRVAASVEPFEFDRIYGAFHPLQVDTGAKDALRRSVERYSFFTRKEIT